VVIDPQMRRIFQLIERIGSSPISLLLLGETGSGKEVVADWAHRCSLLAERPLVPINCAGLTESVIESELFGHERGAFTGAVQAHRGLFEVADGGTLFLDEVAELPLRTQAKLLRVLETGEFTRLGNSQPRRVKVRLIAATHVDMGRLIQRGAFRQDLYFRLNGATIEIPPLRARRAEIVPLAELFLKRCAAALSRPELRLDPSAAAALIEYTWPGNVRELRNAIDCAVALCQEQTISTDMLMLGRSLHSLVPAALPPLADGRPSVDPETAPRPSDMRAEQAEFERRQIVAALSASSGNQTRAASILRISRRTLTNKLNQHGIERPRKQQLVERARRGIRRVV